MKPLLLLLAGWLLAQAEQTGIRLVGNAQPDCQLLLSEDNAATWRDLASFRPDADHNHNQMWLNHVIRGAALDRKQTLLRVIAQGAALEKIVANSAVRTAPSAAAVEVTHRWYEGDRLQTASRTVLAHGAYDVETAPAGIRNHSLRLRLAD